MNETIAALYPAHLAELKRRHDDALKDNGFDRVVIFAGADHYAFLDDLLYPFRTNPHFKSWVPVVDNPNCFLTYEPGQKPRLLFFQPVDYWYKPAEDPKGFWTDQFDIVPLRDVAEARKHLAVRPRTAFIGEVDPASFAEWGFAAINPGPLLDRLHFERAWKTGYEIECMREANLRGARGHLAALKSFRDGASEFEIHLQYLRATSQTESELPYGNIIATNRNGSVLHYQHLERDASARRLSFLIDAGATVNGYASDITRTYSASDRDFEALIAALDTRQQELCGMVRPGIDYRELHFAAHRKIGEILQEFGLVRCSATEAVDQGVTRGFFPHGLGHFIGLQVHDVGGCLANATGESIARPEGHPHLRLTRIIDEGQSFTIEPGLYFIDTLLDEMRQDQRSALVNWDTVARFRPFGGIRIEDDVAVRADGAENLTRDAFQAVTTAKEGDDQLPSPGGRRWPRERPDEGPADEVSRAN